MAKGTPREGVMIEEETTFFLPAKRAERKRLEEQTEVVRSLPALAQFAEVLPGAFIVLNSDRQIVWANKAFLVLANARENRNVRGGRIGEILSCRNAWVMDAGCGTSPACRRCGMARAFSQAADGEPGRAVMRMLRQHFRPPLDFIVRVSKVILGYDDYYFVSATEWPRNVERKTAVFDPEY